VDLKTRIIWQLQAIRNLGDQMLAVFTSPEDWTHQLFPGANHPLWVAGHIAFVDNRILGVFFQKSIENPALTEKFGRQSKPSPNPADYPPPAEVLEFRRERRATLLDCIATLSDADFEKQVPPGLPPFVQNAGQMFSFLAVHEGMHTGQLSMCRRALGHAPVVG
jgi:uncharacterized damage-inducible protein DinB